MITDYKKIDLFGKTFIQKVDVQSPFEFTFPVAEQACFLYMLTGEMQYQSEDILTDIPTRHSLLLNCINSGNHIHNSNADIKGEVVIVTFHPDILKKIYERELPLILQPGGKATNQLSGKINNDFLIHKYIEGLLFYFENPALVNDEILILKLKEIILLLSQTQEAETIQAILSQLFSPTSYTFKQIIEAHLFSPVSIEELAQKTNLSVSSFKREFKKLYDNSPASYLKTKRLERAAELLLISDERISNIAFECGFNDLANFTKSFHDKYNTSPTHYRSKVNKED
ncbi:Exoenzyme S synthesis regulatory protein ExsA [Chryseobacterium oranimense G311]|uniref:helix-turn-helix domain-containing protein n=1 Tax=Chryseobacterium oranimense TaxID=421058 RepID=UPI0005338E04|nr:AraC family transcriptional regulator [Chryseobacterium oranimense]CEJ70606.1 Exoenzyme S synthesis regulatory protein ExsA [Chryseobacterium oranimense G311]